MTSHFRISSALERGHSASESGSFPQYNIGKPLILMLLSPKWCHPVDAVVSSLANIRHHLRPMQGYKDLGSTWGVLN